MRNPSGANFFGTLLEEWISGVAAHVIFPLVRRLGITAAPTLQFNQYTGDNTANGGIDLSARDWTALLQEADGPSAAAGIYVVNIADEGYFCVPPRGRDSASAARIVFTAAIADETGFHGSALLDSDAEISAWLTAEHAMTVAREFIIAVAADRTYIPTF